MGFLNNLSSYSQDGIASSKRSIAKMKLERRIAEINMRRQKFAAQLGASLYEVTKDEPRFRDGREILYDGIAKCDRERQSYQSQIGNIEREARDAQVITCPFCGMRVRRGDRFCSACGHSMEEIYEYCAIEESTVKRQRVERAQRGAQGDMVCPSCGSPVRQGDSFCMSCGAKIEPYAVPRTVYTRGAPDQDSPEEGTLDQGTLEEGTLDQGTLEEGTLDQDFPEEGTPDHNS